MKLREGALPAAISFCSSIMAAQQKEQGTVMNESGSPDLNRKTARAPTRGGRDVAGHDENNTRPQWCTPDETVMCRHWSQMDGAARSVVGSKDL